MDREKFISLCNKKEKLIRTEAGFSQEKMAHVLGISKKTLVEIEKGRRTLGWTGSVALCSIFSDSEVLQAAFGGYPDEVIKSLAFEQKEVVYHQTMGGNIWWRDLDMHNGYKIQQNIMSNHYRILDEKNRRVSSSFDYEEMKMRLRDI
ncbi:MAG: helix-turn-helix domain-containing protein [Lachnospiraceae bacterium]|nr:helix-turn-helix domain-containing protein [Lachnospiraceae bacterium]